jgi:FixJ family two-component response regulator
VNRIFVIDDEPAMGENIQRMLKFPETTVTAYADPVKGLADALAQRPDLVLLDMRMPGMSGEEVFARLHEAHPGVPIVFLTAFGSVEGAVLAMRNGAFDYLQKPFKREELLLVVKRALAHAELEQEVDRLKERLEALGESDHPQSRSAAMLELTDKARWSSGGTSSDTDSPPLHLAPSLNPRHRSKAQNMGDVRAARLRIRVKAPKGTRSLLYYRRHPDLARRSVISSHGAATWES